MRKWALVALVVVILGSASSALAAAGFLRTGAMAAGRFSFPAVTLADGSVLVVSETSLERYDPVAGTFRAAGTITNRGFGPTATRLANGKVLIAGGAPFGSAVDTAEIYDPQTDALTPTSSMTTPRAGHTATLLPNGRVLITGGGTSGHPSSALDSAELYDPVTGVFTPVEAMHAPRQNHTATLLPSGLVLVAGSYGDLASALPSAELFDASTGSFTPTGSMSDGRGEHTATLLTHGKVLVVGGFSAFPGGALDTAEVYDPGTGLFQSTGSMTSPRGAHTSTPLSDGTVLVAGGSTDFPCGGTVHAGSEVYDPLSGTFAPSATMHEARLRHAAAALPGGGVLVVGGIGQFCAGPFQSAEVYFASVVDTQPPVITVPADMTLLAQGPDGANVTYAVTVVDDVDPAPVLSCVPASGSLFPAGSTTVDCDAHDASSNASSASFVVSVVPALDLAITIDAVGGVYPATGLATLGGRVLCSRPANGFVSGSLTQGQAQGSFSRSFNCVPPHSGWNASVLPTAGRFAGGTAQATATLSGCDSLGSCDSDSASRPVTLRQPQPSPSLVTMRRIADTTTPMPRVGARFSFFSGPFVRKGGVVFLGYAGTPQGTVQGLYSSSGDSLQVVADSHTRIPGKPGRFFSFDSPTFDGTTVAFQGRDDLFGAGLYASRDGRLTRIADDTTPVPGSTEVFRDFVGPVVSNGRVAFRGSSDYSSFSSFGVYSGDASGLLKIADRQTAIPGGTENFLFFQTAVSLDGPIVAFSGGGNVGQGVYAGRGGSLTTVADLATTNPGGTGGFLFFGAPASDRGRVAFMAFDTASKPGIYLRTPGGPLQRIADATTNVPFGTTTFGSFSDPVLDNGVVAFSALDSHFAAAGIYTGSGESLNVVADVRTPVPGGQGTFSFFTPPAFVDGRIAFLGGDFTFGQGVYVQAYGELRKVVDTTDIVEGKALSNIQFATASSCNFDCHGGMGTGFDGTYATFLASFTDGSQGIYRATIGRPFAQLGAAVSSDHGRLSLQTSFRLGAGNNGIDPAREAVALQVGTFSTWIAPGSFRAVGNGRYRFTGRIDGVDVKVDIEPAAGGRYSLSLDANCGDFTGTSGLVTVNIAIGDDAGATRVTARR